ncbi:MAG: hypothetical protein ACD_5C00089G0003 [uncultured bacterium]|nr:MAG: hypothetical protein ACD_5C00089G0003 [uncultured bacterium]
MSKEKKAMSAEQELKRALENLFEAYRKKLISERIKKGLAKRKKKVLENAKRSYNTRNIKTKK